MIFNRQRRLASMQGRAADAEGDTTAAFGRAEARQKQENLEAFGRLDSLRSRIHHGQSLLQRGAGARSESGIVLLSSAACGRKSDS